MSKSSDPPPESIEPLEHFVLPRTILRELRACSSSSESKPAGDIFFLWLQLETNGAPPAIAPDQWLNVLDEAASVGVNWLVLTLGATAEPVELASMMCRWAQDTHGMTVCLHASSPSPDPAIESLVLAMPREKTYLLVESEYAAAYGHLNQRGVRVGLASPTAREGDTACDYPYKMVFVDAGGNLYTCGLVAGEKEFFLGSVFSGSLERIVHNPRLPHSVDALETRPKQGCSGCPPLVAKYLCQQ